MAEVVAVARLSDVHAAIRAAKKMALSIGFDEKVSEEIAIAAGELSTNLVKYTKGGRLTLAPIGEGIRTGIQIDSHDDGPGISDVERAIADGFSTGGSLGYGLGAINRLMDEFDITSDVSTPVGTHIVCTRWLSKNALSVTPCPLEFGVATRARPMMAVNGDAFVVKRWGASALVSVIDGLGHGPDAHRAAEAARYYIETHYDQKIDVIFRGTARTCRSTRGVVMTVVRFDFAERPVRFACASIGNIEIRIFGDSTDDHFIVRRGVLGGNAPSPKITDHSWQPGNVMVLHSDGLASHWCLVDFPELVHASAATIAGGLLRALAKSTDDATVVVVRDAAHD